MPSWLMLLFQMMNLLGSSALIGGAVYHQTNSPEGGIIAGVSALGQQIRSNPFVTRTEATKEK